MEELNLGETALWIGKVENNKFHLLANTSCSIMGAVEHE